MLNLNHNITKLRGADYNPRKITEQDLANLAESVKELGVVKPIIARGNLIVAGHQRTKALRRLGIETAPVYQLPTATTTYDEIRFNQLHNGTDMDCGDEKVFIRGGFKALGYTTAAPELIEGNHRSRMANVRNEICSLIKKYGPWGGVVATLSGEVIHCAQYALASAVSHQPLTVYVIPDDQKAKYQGYLNKQYGVFSYDHLQKDTYIQTFAQMFRLRDGESGNKRRSTLYENDVIPWLTKNPKARGLDFGSGQGDYVKMLKAKGANLKEIELFRRTVGKMAIDRTAVNRMIDAAIFDVRLNGLFDYVVCDSVLNSVDCSEAEWAVLAIVSLFCKPDGMVFFSGRNSEVLAQYDKLTKAGSKKRFVEFVDDKGFTALYRKGHWFYQKYHTPEQVEELITRLRFTKVSHNRKRSSGSWQVVAVKSAPLTPQEYKKAIDYEFNLPYSKTDTIKRHTDVWDLMKEKYNVDPTD